MDRPVSVVIPTYRRNKSLIRAIESVRHQQYDSSIEIIVVDDSGTEHAKNAVEDLDITYIPHETNKGPIGAWNTGVSRASGEYIQILDDDDRLLPQKLSKQSAILVENDQIGLVHSGFEWGFGIPEQARQDMRGDVLELALTLDTSPCVTSTFLMRSEILQEFFPLTEYRGAADDLLKIEMAKRTKFDFVEEPLVRRGVNETNVSESKRAIQACFQLLSDYENLYEQSDPSIRKKALAKTYSRKGEYYLSTRRWSHQAIHSLAKANRHNPGFDVKMFATLLLSFSGRFGYTQAHRLMRYIKSSK